MKILPIEHPEKISKKELVIMFIEQKQFLWKDVEAIVVGLRNKIHNETKQSILMAENAFISTHQPLILAQGTKPVTR